MHHEKYFDAQIATSSMTLSLLRSTLIDPQNIDVRKDREIRRTTRKAEMAARVKDRNIKIGVEYLSDNPDNTRRG